MRAEDVPVWAVAAAIEAHARHPHWSLGTVSVVVVLLEALDRRDDAIQTLENIVTVLVGSRVA